VILDYFRPISASISFTLSTLACTFAIGLGFPDFSVLNVPAGLSLEEAGDFGCSSIVGIFPFVLLLCSLLNNLVELLVLLARVLLFAFLHAFRSIFFANGLREHVSLHGRVLNFLKVDDFFSDSYHTVVVLIQWLDFRLFVCGYFNSNSTAYLNIEVSEQIELASPSRLSHLPSLNVQCVLEGH